MMLSNYNLVPPGWRKLGMDEVIDEGDKYSTGNSTDWKSCIGSIGRKPHSFNWEDFIFIRKEEKKQDKEWLNPWDNL